MLERAWQVCRCDTKVPLGITRSHALVAYWRPSGVPWAQLNWGLLMGEAYRVALVGFSHSEVNTFESFFQMAARRPPAYQVQDEVLDAQVLIVNADDAQAMHLVRHAALPGKVLLVGRSDRGSGWPVQHRPVKLVQVLAALDGVMGRARPVSPQRRSSDKVPEPARNSPRWSAPATAFAPTLPMPRPDLPLLAEHRVGVLPLTEIGAEHDLPVHIPRSPHGRRDADTKHLPPTEHGDMLVVSQSLVEGRVLVRRFKKYGLKADWSREAGQAQALMQAHPYRVVVIDHLTGHPDAYELCRTAKKTQGPKGPPVVILFSLMVGTMERMRASLAGCDAFLSRSVNEVDLYKTLAQHRLVNRDGFAPTNFGF